MNKQFKKIIIFIIGTFLLSGLSANLNKTDVSALVDTPWGPDRRTFTWEDPAPYATFNSITNNPALGDERNFVRVREVKIGEKFGDEVTVKPGKTYEVYIYYHNNADAHDVGKTAIGIADGASVKSSFPSVVRAGERATVTGTIFAADTDPLEVWDGAYLMPTQDMYLRYVPGTATIHNGGTLNGSSIGPDYLFGDGALLGYNKFSGLLPGCNEYAGYITYQIFADAPGFSISKSVVGDNTNVNKGDIVTFKVRYDNTGTMDQSNVVIRDTLPAGLEYISGTTRLYNNNYPEGKEVNDDVFTDHGMNIGNYAGGSGWAEVTYDVRVKDDLSCEDRLSNSVVVSTSDGNKKASLTLRIVGPDCGKTPDGPDDPEDPDDPDPEDPKEDYCKTNPNLPGCTAPTTEDCKTNPNLPGCEEPNPDPDPEPTEPAEKNCKTNPEMPECQRLPETGPVQIVLALVIVLGIGGGGFYYYRTHKKLKTVEADVTGKDPKNPDEPRDNFGETGPEQN